MNAKERALAKRLYNETGEGILLLNYKSPNGKIYARLKTLDGRPLCNITGKLRQSLEYRGVIEPVNHNPHFYFDKLKELYDAWKERKAKRDAKRQRKNTSAESRKSG